ncbi:MAG: GNAT family N-acetyltransferase [Streptosporangiaceae bacterium]|nr:GNAT family N-acetyltransferase [Streptosporangiaceae bacterium]MBV9855364.1 GNAT family N-acetyltransferase [Streptosporangiaceae bacterium]
MVIRAADTSDAPALADLWRAAGIRFRAEHVAAELASVLARDPDLVLVEQDETGAITGSVFGTYDGRRGWVNRLATSPARRGRGIATHLLAELELRLIARGCPKVNLLIEPGNAGVARFYERLGYRLDELVFMEKWIIPNETWHTCQPAGSGQWHDLSPELHAIPYVFATAPEIPAGVSPFAVIREDEALTLVLPRADADRAGLRYDHVAARITLRINSALAAIGLTAAVSRLLAEAGISCNVIAGAAHDHLFTAWPRRHHALTLLRTL